MRIAIIADPLDNQQAGVHVFTREMVKALLRQDHSHEILLIREAADPELHGARQIAIRNIRLPIGFASLRLFFLIPWVLRREQVDAVIEPAHFGPFNLGPSVRRVTIIHDLTPVLFKHLHRWHSQVLQNLFLRRILRKANLVIANSENTRRDIERVYPFSQGKVVRMYPGANPAFTPRADHEVLRRHGIDAPYFLSVGTIEPRKNLVRLLEAYGQFRDTTESRTLLVLAGGRGWKCDAFDAALSRHPWRRDIRMLGYTDLAELPPLYTGAIATVYPSLYEGFGLPLLESLRCGTPVITSDVSSMPEVAGPAGLYAQPEDVGRLAEHMQALATDRNLRDHLASLCVAQAGRFSWDAFASQFIKALEQLTRSHD